MAYNMIHTDILKFVALILGVFPCAFILLIILIDIRKYTNKKTSMEETNLDLEKSDRTANPAADYNKTINWEYFLFMILFWGAAISVVLAIAGSVVWLLYYLFFC
jgi:hypothetical protein